MRRMPRSVVCVGVTVGTIALVGDRLAAQECARPSLSRALVVVGGFAAAEAMAILMQQDDWWTTPTRSFYFSNLPSASKGQDNLLHMAITYEATQVGAVAWRWACQPPTAAAWLGAALGFAVSLPKELGDGFHEGKGFSLSDVAWSAGGAILPALHATWTPSRVLQLKGNYWPSPELLDRQGSQPTLFTDYAGQRYFLAIDPGLFEGGAGPWPDWLGVAVGHSVPQWIIAPPEHEWYVTLDLNLRGLPIKAPWWHRVASVLDQVKVPLPGVRLRSGEVTFGVY